MPVGFKHSWLSTSHYLLEKHSQSSAMATLSERKRKAEPGAVYRPSALRGNGDSRARDPGQHAGDTVLRQHRLQAGSAHL